MKTAIMKAEKYPSWIFSADGICVSVIVPLHKLAAEKMADPLRVQKALTKAKEQLEVKTNEPLFTKLAARLDALYEQIDFTKFAEGIGLYVSASQQQMELFHFPVKEKVLVAEKFDARDWLYQQQYLEPYLLLHLDEKNARLFRGSFPQLTEVHDAHFPHPFLEEYEYNPPARGSSYAGHAVLQQFEKDKAQLHRRRYTEFLQQVDDDLKLYVNDIPLMVAGALQHLADYKKVAHHFVVAELKGNYDKNMQQLEHNAAEAWRQWQEHLKDQRIAELTEAMGTPRAVTGLDECWKTVQEGKALRLLVEKDFAKPGFLPENNKYNLMQTPPAAAHTTVPDAVNALIMDALNQNAEVILIENGPLRKFGSIGVITRY